MLALPYDLFSQLPDDSPRPPVEPQVFSVTELTVRIKDLLETSFGSVWVAGEISNFARPQSGHCYLTLKDDQAQVRCAMWRNALARVRFDLHDGLEVVCRCRCGGSWAGWKCPRRDLRTVQKQLEA